MMNIKRIAFNSSSPKAPSEFVRATTISFFKPNPLRILRSKIYQEYISSSGNTKSRTNEYPKNSNITNLQITNDSTKDMFPFLIFNYPFKFPNSINKRNLNRNMDCFDSLSFEKKDLKTYSGNEIKKERRKIKNQICTSIKGNSIVNGKEFPLKNLKLNKLIFESKLSDTEYEFCNREKSSNANKIFQRNKLRNRIFFLYKKNNERNLLKTNDLKVIGSGKSKVPTFHKSTGFQNTFYKNRNKNNDSMMKKKYYSSYNSNRNSKFLTIPRINQNYHKTIYKINSARIDQYENRGRLISRYFNVMKRNNIYLSKTNFINE